jgi:hypothetical protein
MEINMVTLRRAHPCPSCCKLVQSRDGAGCCIAAPRILPATQGRAAGQVNTGLVPNNADAK